MRNKRLNFLLVPAVIAIWAGVGYVVFFPDKPQNQGDVVSMQGIPLISKTEDLAEKEKERGLLLSYPDPFLADADPAPARPAQVLMPNPTTGAAKPPPPPPKPKPELVEFLGVVSSRRNDAFVALIRFRGGTHTLRKGDSLGPYVIRQIQRDTLWAAGYDTLLSFARQ